MSTDGRYLSFLRSGAAFRYDWASDTTALVSHVAGNPIVVANGTTMELDASADGRFVTFSSAATDLVAGVSDTNDADVFVWDGATGVVGLVSHSAGMPLVSVTEDAGRPTISADGGFVALQSAAGGLVTGLLPTTSNNDLYLWSRAADTIQLVSHAADEPLRRAGARDLAVVSSDGQFVAFASSGTDLVAGQAGPPDPVSAVYRFDRLLDASLLVSHSHVAANFVASVGSWRPRMSGDGRWISFLSGATDLVAGTSGPSVALPFPSELYLFDAALGSSLMLSRTEGTAADHGLSYIYGFDVAASAALVAWADVAGRHDPTVADPPGVQSVLSYRIGSGVTELVSRRAADRPAATATVAVFSYSPQVVLSAGGAKAALLSSAADLVAEPYGYWLGILAAFLWDRPTASIHELDRPIDELIPASGPSAAVAVSADGSASLILSANPALVPGQINGAGPAVGDNLFWRQNETGLVTLLSHADGEPLHGLAQDVGTVEVSRNAGFAATVREDVDGQHVVLYDLAGGTSTSLATTVEGSQAPSSWSVWWLSASGDGRWWALLSPAGDLVPGQVDEPSVDVFLYDRETASYQLVSHVVDNVVTAAGGVSMARVTLDGRFVVFVSTASNLVAGQVDAPDTPDVFLYDRLTGVVSLVSHAVGASVQAGNGQSWEAAIDADGRHIVFSTLATDVVAGASDANAGPDVVLVDRLAGTRALVSHVNGQPAVAASGGSSSPVLADDGATIAFVSTAPDLVLGQVDTNGAEDVFVTELRRQRTRLVSFAGASGVAGHVAGAGTWGSIQPVLSPEGATVAFSSLADDLVAGDYNASPDAFLYVVTEPVLEAPDKSLISR